MSYDYKICTYIHYLITMIIHLYKINEDNGLIFEKEFGNYTEYI